MNGLTRREVEERIENGQINANENPNTRTVKQIILQNSLTFFNFLNLSLVVMVLLVGSYKNTLFFGVIIFNTVIGIVQEIRAKAIIDKLAILTQSKTVVLREGKKWSIATDQLVIDDIIYLKTGDQVPADAEVVEGAIEVNESLLTGEADNLTKRLGDQLFSGSFVTSGEAACQIIHVGKDNYAAQITSEAKEYKKHNSELRNSMNAILKVVSIMVIPVGALMFYKQYYMVGNTLRDSVVAMVASVLGMIPDGLVLLTSIALTLGAVYLAQKKTLVQEMYCIETLAHVDTLCLDKTGTITEGTMCVEAVEPYSYEMSVVNGEDMNDDMSDVINGKSLEEIESIMGNIMSVQHEDNTTALALHKRFPDRSDMTLLHQIPFSSDRKYSGAVFEEGTFLVGAVQFLFPEGYGDLLEKGQEYAAKGLRVLTLAYSPILAEEVECPEGLQPIALIMVTDVIRAEAPDTLAFFDAQGVDLKVISGDDPVTVSAIAQKAGLKNAERFVDATTLTSEEDIAEAVKNYSVFGRVTPQQKKAMVLALKAQGHTVAMTGDGVNDVLAFKEADCSIAMAEGSDAAKNVANVVLLDSNFASMPHIVNQGRRVVNNIRTAASMFLIKTIFSALLAVLTICFGDVYPFEPIQMSLISACAVGIPTFLLAQEFNYEKIDHTFLRHVFMNAFPAGVTITTCVFTLMLICQHVYHSTAMLGTACVLVTGWNYMSALRTVYSPLNTYRKIVIYGMQMGFFLAAAIMRDLLVLGPLEFRMIILVLVMMNFSPIAIDLITEQIRIQYRNLDTENPGKFLTFIRKLQKKPTA